MGDRHYWSASPVGNGRASFRGATDLAVASYKPDQPERSRGQKRPKAGTGATRNAGGVSMAKPRLLTPAERRLSEGGERIGQRPMRSYRVWIYIPLLFSPSFLSCLNGNFWNGQKLRRCNVRHCQKLRVIANINAFRLNRVLGSRRLPISGGDGTSGGAGRWSCGASVAAAGSTSGTA